ncbi:hypothetical protein CCC_04116 [Paramagnetospirillum magnetotacticum MS-1]|uniref:Uncharacterized protein n=1 Tax=Paramagnetospirillum magnetotacticum MS-1 TaxID=272627 RepID=A0A0C2YY88_PARME|nr:hypothetical protein CCC_04116 [Paramagnetospirillum magnetotacticum MS-1]
MEGFFKKVLPRIRVIYNKPTKRKVLIVLHLPLNFELVFFDHISTASDYDWTSVWGL